MRYRRALAAIIALGLELATSGSVAASGFTLYEHVTKAPAESDHGTRPPMEVFDPSTKAALSFREALFLPAIAEAERRHGLPPNLLRALIWTESRFNPSAVSVAGAVGLAQLMPATARDLGVHDRYDPDASIDGGARYLRAMIDRFGAVHLALAAYNAGPGAVSRSWRIPRNGETPQYVRTVLQRWSALGTGG
ncbi:lytic transglycosylase domain-containing protein [Altererythrobacter sp. KTW20L]|uniref:lytic transglycosylase domain-containing protein n=1 Tax=Altererythrobacter sp. KTW20L TaxID=2942210 RepID=UPI0020BDCDA9|nr:lytic transglycosylase domain-containing protein [Altererythrobacter sp. KTW20L]MCL6252254.1 lytic transglycosylase domain-containing protein [Altererythrobacter sp. KTW20L]